MNQWWCIQNNRSIQNIEHAKDTTNHRLTCYKRFIKDKTKHENIWFVKKLNPKHKLVLKEMFLWWKTTTKDSTKYMNHFTYNFKGSFINMIYLDLSKLSTTWIESYDVVSKTINQLKT